MSGYSQADLAEGWEFKIPRSATGAFKHPDRLRQALDEESHAGWVMVEKFDNQRVRLKRPASARAGNTTPGVDPYRRSYGVSEGALTAAIMASVFATIGVILLIIFLATRH